MDRFATSLLGEAKTLLLATDGSSYSEGAIQEAIFFGQACRAKVIVLHVVRTRAESLGAANATVRRGREELASHFDRIRAMAQDSGVMIETVLVGSEQPAQTIVEQARLRQADVILLGRHGKGGRLSLLVGKMTAQVLAQGFPRVLVVPKDALITGNSLLVAIDDSVSSRQAAQEALSLGRTCATLQRMTVLSVAFKEDERGKAEELVGQVLDQGRQDGLPVPCDGQVRVGEPADCIVQVAHELSVDLIIVGGMSRPGVTMLLKGQVSEQVIGQAPCAVLVITA
jgi:nucleotide-binding universal stress UspA family protein